MRLSKLALLACLVASPAWAGQWHLVALNGAPFEGTTTLTLKGGAIAGEGPCNQFWAQVVREGEAVSIRDFGATKRLCLVEGGEGAVFSALTGADRLEETAERLSFTGPGGSLEFAP